MADDMGTGRPRRSDKYAAGGKRRGSGSPRSSRKRSTSRRAVGNPLEAPPELPVHRQRRKVRRKRTVAIVAFVLVVVLLGIAGVVWAYMTGVIGKMQADDATKQAVNKVVTKAEPQKPFTILLLGDDSRPGETMARSDTMIVARIDPQTKKVWLLSIPRDTRAEIPGHGVNKINTATAYGGPALAIETVENFLGIEINGYMSINFTGFVEMVDSLGGVWVNVEKEIDDRKAASHSTDPDAQHIPVGHQLLDGEHALTFVRTRDYADGDFSRMKNQQAFFKALADQVKKTGNAAKLPGIVSSLAEHITTTMSGSEMMKAALALMDAGSDNVYTATVTGTWKSPFVYTDEAVKQHLVSAMEAGHSFDDTSTATGQSVKPADVTVTVRNGAGISGFGASAASVLTGDGFVVSEIGNANQFVYDRTLIVYDAKSADGLLEAQSVSASLPIGDLVASNGMYSFTTDILVVVGKDWQSATKGD